jgi:hypothetical protein
VRRPLAQLLLVLTLSVEGAASVILPLDKASKFLAGPVSTFEPWGKTAIDSYSRSGNVATVIAGPPQTITISGLADDSFNGTFTITSMDGDQNHLTAANVGANVSTTAGIGIGTLTSPAVTVTPSGILHGTTRYDYKVVLREYNGALSAASPAGTTLVGAATLGSNLVAVTGCTCTSGVVTCTTGAIHNLQVGATERIDAKRLRLILDGGTPFATFRAELSAFRNEYRKPDIGYKFFKMLVLFVTLITPPKTFLAAVVHATGPNAISSTNWERYADCSRGESSSYYLKEFCVPHH